MGTVVKRGGWSCKKKKKAVLGIQNVVEESHGQWGCRRARNNAHFGVLQIKGGAEKALGSWEVPRSRRRHWGEGVEEGSLGQWPGVPQGPCLGFRGALGIPTPPPLDSPNPPSTKDTA